MASFGDNRDSTVITMTSPDQNIHVRFSNGKDAEVWFRPDAYRRYREDQLSHQLARLGATTWVAYHRAQAEAYRREQGLSTEEVAAGEQRLMERPNHREYTQALNNIEGDGVSPSGVIRIHTRGLLEWCVEIAPGTIREFSEEQFLAELHAAFNSLMNDREMQAVILKSEMFDMGIPRKWLDMMKDLKAARNRRR